MKSAIFFLTSLLAATASALPNSSSASKNNSPFSGCSSIDASAFTPPAGLPPVTTPFKFVGMAFGTQNYTCNSTTSTYSSIGAVARLFDFSCAAGSSSNLFEIEKRVFQAWTTKEFRQHPLEYVFKRHKYWPTFLGDHYFVPNPAGSGLSPEWDFRQSRNDANAYVIAAKTGDVPSPDGSANISWLSLKNVQGKLADGVYRAFTIAGQPPASCSAGSPTLTVDYAAIYYFV